MVDDNFHFMDASERTTSGTFDTLEAAIAACKKIVDEDLAHSYKPGMPAETLYDLYRCFGDDPWIAGDETFSAWDFAKKRSGEICASTWRNLMDCTARR